jgi:hypothetical protein
MTKKSTKLSPVFSAIEAHRQALRQVTQASRACELLKKKRPELAPDHVPTWEKVPGLDDSRRKAWEHDQDIHKKARKRAGILRAEKLDYEATMKARRNLTVLCSLRPVNMDEAAAMAKHLLQNLKAEVAHFHWGKWAGKTEAELQEREYQRSLALDWTLKVLRRIAEASEKKKPVQPRRKKITNLRLAA